MKSNRITIFLATVSFFFMGMTPLLAENVQIGGHGEQALDRPFCGV